MPPSLDTSELVPQLLGPSLTFSYGEYREVVTRLEQLMAKFDQKSGQKKEHADRMRHCNNQIGECMCKGAADAYADVVCEIVKLIRELDPKRPMILLGDL